MPSVGTAALTIIGGVLVYVLGKIIERAFIEPLNDYRRLVMEIAGALAMHASFWADTSATETLASSFRLYGEQEPYGVELSKAVSEASRDLRAKAAQLGAYALTIPWYRLWSLLRFVPKRGDLLLASSELVGMANKTPPRNHDEAQDNMRANRRIQVLLRMATK
jgi:hypothetical protein